MPPPPNNPFPSLRDVNSRLERLQKEFDGHCAIVMRELGSISHQIAELREPKEDRPSQAQFSWSPGKARANLGGLPAWAVVAVVLIVATAITVTCTSDTTRAGGQAPPSSVPSASGVGLLRELSESRFSRERR